jgi:hypothetical protein
VRPPERSGTLPSPAAGRDVFETRPGFRARAWAAALVASQPSVRELVLAAALLAALAAAVFGSYLADGGLYIDDRWFYSFYEFAPGYFSGVEAIMESGEFGFRPLQAAQMAGTYAVFGLDATPLLAVALALTIGAAACFYALLRELGLERLHAGAIAALALVSPAADSTKLWTAAGHNNLALVLYFAGAAVVLRGFAAGGRRATLLHAASLLMYALSILVYEVAAAAMLLSVLLYRLRVPWRPAVRRWLADVVVVGAVLVVNAVATDRDAQSVGDMLSTVEQFARDAVSLVLAAGVPHGTQDLLLPLFALAVLAGLSAVVWPEWRGDTAIRSQVERWLVVSGVAAVGIAVAYVMLVPAGYLRPLGLGIDNRTNLMAAFAIVAFLYGVFMVTGTLVFRFTSRWREASIAFALVLSAVVGVAYLDRLNDDKTRWEQAAAVHGSELAALEAALPDPPPDSTVYSVGNRESVSSGLPGLIWWDLYGAGRLMWGPSVRPVLVPPATTWTCTRDALGPNLSYALADRVYETGGMYGRSYVVDVRTGSVERIDSPRDCRRLQVPAAPAA